ncbi:MAG TPA: hypothetical protein VF195_12475 [Actinomycetota bacterium]
MNDIPPPPSPGTVPGVPTPRPTGPPTSRPGAVTGAAAILLIAGALVTIFGLMGLTGNGVDIDAPFLDGDAAARIVALALVVQGILSLLAGWLVLRLRPAGRVLGLLLAALGIVGGLAQVRRTGSAGLLTFTLNAFVIYVLLTYGFLFKPREIPR